MQTEKTIPIGEFCQNTQNELQSGRIVNIVGDTATLSCLGNTFQVALENLRPIKRSAR